ncbi:hypothetical protein [Desulfuromonas sp. AOP6]|uniref:hypothetical protein n=1 Tax=Desulfuromonas sp. AOP6 TaxID=1566351 RepID=UPI0012DDDA05|nr:hypothetical protein [Desulfuromonas sp. AOP6]
MFEKWWESHKFIINCEKDLARSIYESAMLDVADWLEPQRNDYPCTGEEFAEALRYEYQQAI